MNKVISETDETGRKLKTFVPANGTTLATQTIYYTTTPATEILTFNHMDASGTGAQETTASGVLNGNTTNSRRGEYSPLGRNIAGAGPYITLNTYEPPDEGGVNMFGSGQGYRPGQQTFAINGIAVSASRFMDEINSGLIGGAFGLLEIAARISAREMRLQSFRVGNSFFSADLKGANFAITEAIETGLPIIRNIVIDTSWSVLLTVYRPQQDKSLQEARKRRLSANEKTILERAVDEMLKVKDAKETCLEKLNKLLGALNSKYTDFNDLVSDIFSNKNGYKLRITEEPVSTTATASTLGGSIVLNSSVTIENHNVDFIHEVIHAANKKNNYTHRAIAEAIAEVEGLNIKRFDDWYKKNAPDVEDPGGGLLNSFIREYCTEGESSWAEWLGRFI